MHPNSITIRYIIYGQYVLLILQQRNNNTILHRIVSIKNILNNIISCIKALMLFVFLSTLNFLYFVFFSLFFSPLSTNSLFLSLSGKYDFFLSLKLMTFSLPLSSLFFIQFQLVFMDLFWCQWYKSDGFSIFYKKTFIFKPIMHYSSIELP